MLGSQMRLPGAGGASLPLPSPRHFLGPGGGQDIETSIQNWRDSFLNKYQEQNREVGLSKTEFLPPIIKKLLKKYDLNSHTHYVLNVHKVELHFHDILLL